MQARLLGALAVMAARPSYSIFDRYDHAESDTGVITFPRSIDLNACPICGGRFVDLEHELGADKILGLNMCGTCGRWHLHQDMRGMIVDPTSGGLVHQQNWA